MKKNRAVAPRYETARALIDSGMPIGEALKKAKLPAGSYYACKRRTSKKIDPGDTVDRHWPIASTPNSRHQIAKDLSRSGRAPSTPREYLSIIKNQQESWKVQIGEVTISGPGQYVKSFLENYPN